MAARQSATIAGGSEDLADLLSKSGPWMRRSPPLMPLPGSLRAKTMNQVDMMDPGGGTGSGRKKRKNRIDRHSSDESTTSSSDSGGPRISGSGSGSSSSSSSSSSPDLKEAHQKRHKKVHHSRHSHKDGSYPSNHKLIKWARKVHTDTLHLKSHSTQLVNDFDARARDFLTFARDWTSQQAATETELASARAELGQAAQEFAETAAQAVETAGDLVKAVDLKLVKFNALLANVLEVQELQNETIQEMKIGQREMIRMLQGRVSESTLVESQQQERERDLPYVRETTHKRKLLLSDDMPLSDNLY